MPQKIEDLALLISGQLITSRTETLEDYFKSRAATLGVIGITSPFASKNVSRCTLYQQGEPTREFNFSSFQIKNITWYKRPLLIISFGLYFIMIINCALRLKKRFDYFIGISCFSAFTGIFLKKAGIVKRLIYYSIDYYPLPVKFNFNYLMVKAFNIADKFCVHSADMTWHISPRIAEARQKFAKVNSQSYRYLTAPLTYAQNIQRFKPLEEVERYTIGFVGTLSDNQGLQLLIKAMPEIIKKIPQVRVKIIGKGPYELTLKKMANDAGLNSYLNFLGFIREEEKVLNILANCAIGVAPWTCSPDDNILYADPGKPKLYAFCGIPTVITNGTPIAQELNNRRAGVSINYDRVELARAIIELLGDETKLKEYKKNSSELAKDYTSEKIFDRVFQEMIQVEGKR